MEAAAEEALKRLPSWQAAARVSGAVMEFARTGGGDVRRMDGQELRLHVGPYVVRMGFDPDAHVLRVWTVFQKS